MRSRRPSFQKWISALLLPCYLSACTSWHRDTQPLPETLAAERTPTLRFTLTNGQRITLAEPRQVGDSVVGKDRLSPQELDWESRVEGNSLRVAIALADVQTVERPTVSERKTGWLIVGMGLLAAMAVWAAKMDAAFR